MYVICSLVLALSVSGHKTLITEDVVGLVLSSSDLRYEVDFDVDMRRITYRDTSIDYKHYMVKKDLCVRL